MGEAWCPYDRGVSTAGSDLGPPSWSDPVTSEPQVMLDGWRAHRRRVRRNGPWWALLPALGAGLGAAVALWGSAVWWRGVVGVLLAVTAAPLLPVAGVPATNDTQRMVVAVMASAAVWWVLGWVAARRSTAVPGASWPEWRRDFGRLAVGFVLGGWAALALAAVVVGIRAR